MAAVTATLARKVAFRAEHTGNAGQDRAQRLAQQTATAHEQTKNVVAALMNHAYATLVTDTTIATAAYATLLTATITTVLPTGHLVLSFSASGGKTTGAGTAFFELFVDGVLVKGCYVQVPLNVAFATSMVARAAVSKGTHTVLLKWRTDVSSLRINAASIGEEHAHLLVQEAL